MNQITTNDFLDIHYGFEWIKENIRNNSATSKFKKGKYHFYFTVNKDDNTITANETDDKSEFTVSTTKKLDIKKEEFLIKTAQIHGLEYVSFTHYLSTTDDIWSEDNINEIQKKYIKSYVVPIAQKFELSDFENNDLFAEEFDNVCDYIWWQMVTAIERKYGNLFWKRLTFDS